MNSQQPREKRVVAYTDADLATALFEIRNNKMAIREASRKFCIPRTTLQDRVHGRSLDEARKKGPCTVLSSEEEAKLVNWLITLAKCGFPQKQEDLIQTVQNILKEEGRKTPFKDNRPGRKWYYSFLKRHPNLSIRTPESLTKSRAAITEQGIRKWFGELQNFLKEEGVEDILEDPSRIFNADETGFSMAPKTGTVISPKGYKNLYQIKSANEKDSLTVLLTFSASGKMLPPMVVLPYKRSPGWLKTIEKSKPDWVFGKTEKGWMRGETFLQYVEEGFHTWLSKSEVKRPVLFFVDGHASHMSLELSDFCSTNGIILYALPPNTTHIMQPADVGAFKGLKSDYKHILKEWQKRNDGITINKETFCDVLGEVLECKDRTVIIQNAFRKCGLFPFNPDAVDYTKCVQNVLESENDKSNVEGSSGIGFGGVPSGDLVCDLVGSVDIDVEADAGVNEAVHSGGVLKTFSDKTFEDFKLLTTHLKDEFRKKNIDYKVVNEIIRQAQQRKNNSGNSNEVENSIMQSIEGTYHLETDGLLTRVPEALPSPCNQNIEESLAAHLEQEERTGTVLTDLQNVIEMHGQNDLNTTDDMFLYEICSQIADENELVFNEILEPGYSCKASTSKAASFEKHLVCPRPIPHKRKRAETVKRPPSAISSPAWKTFKKSKEDAKKKKAEDIERRKLERLSKRDVKKKQNKKTPKCPTCEEDVLTDVEDEGLTNIGCDKCTEWYHLKCTSLCHMSSNDALMSEFVCPSCDS